MVLDELGISRFAQFMVRMKQTKKLEKILTALTIQSCTKMGYFD